MTRIYDALKKAESTPRRLGLGPSSLGGMPGHDPGAGWGHAQAEPTLTPLPLIGGVELTEDSIRETTGLRVNLESVLPDRNVRSVMFSSAQSGEGTTTVALQFAQTLAHSGARVLFVDANARRPACFAEGSARVPALGPRARARVLVVDANARRPACFAEASHRFAVLDPRVGSMAMAGVMTPNLGAIPATEEGSRNGLISTAAIRSVLDAALGAFDWVVVDGPAVVDSPDAASLAAQVDGVVMVVHAGRAKRPVVARAVEMLRKSGGRVLGTVLNRRIHEIPGFIYRRI